MDERARELMQAQLRKLSYRNGEGIVEQIKRKMDASIRVLLIGFGGTGLDALECTMHELQQAVTPEQYKNQISVLAVDTSKNALTSSADDFESANPVVAGVPKDRFNRNTEWLLLPYEQAQQWKELPSLVPNEMNKWVNPNVFSLAKFNGEGASRIRQAGRVLLTQPAAAEALVTKIQAKASALNDRRDAKLAVFLFFGIAGGTGSGCVIDGTYLVRHAVDAVCGGDDDTRASLCGYIFLPAVGEKVTTANHANAYAALKEISHFMTLDKRGEVFSQNYGNIKVISKKNLFDKCILMEGQVNGITNDYKQCRSKAFNAAANTVLDNITAVPVTTTAGQAFHSIDDYLNNLDQDMLQMVANHKDEEAPRSANYSFSVVGQASALVPIDLLKSYVMNEVFQKTMKLFNNCDQADREAAKKFLRETSVIGKGPLNASYDNAKRNVDKYLKEAFADMGRGPSYVVNLLNEAASYMQEKHLNDDQRKMANYLRRMNNTVFEVYTEVIKQMAEYLSEASGILTNTNMRNNISGSRFSWMLVDFDPKISQNNAFIQKYLSHLVNQKQIKSLVQKLLDEMNQNVSAWTELMVNDASATRQPRFQAAKRLREFITTHVDKIVYGSVEDFLVRYYTNNINATCTRADGSVTEEGKNALKVAAAEIIKEMFTSSAKALPLAKIRDFGMISRNALPSKAFMYIPQAAPNLERAIREQINTDSKYNNVAIYSGTASDRIACYWRYDCIPAHQIEWVLEGEKAYEYNLEHSPVGLHLSETVGGNQWRDLPNLCHQRVWPLLEEKYEQPREASLAERALETLKTAEKLGQTEQRRGKANVNVCWLRLLPEECIPAPLMFKAVDHENEGTPPHVEAMDRLEADVAAKAQKLYDQLQLGDRLLATHLSPECKDEFGRQALIKELEARDDCPNVDMIQVGGPKDTMGPGDYAADDEIHKTWTIDLAAQLIRCRMDLMFRLRGNVLVMEKLAQLVEENNDRIRHSHAAASAIEDFVKLCAMDVLTYSEFTGLNEDDEEDTLYQWLYADEDDNDVVLANLNPTDALQMTAKHYYAFQAYMQLPEEERARLKEVLSGKVKTNNVRKEAKAKVEELQALLEKLRTAKDAPKAPTQGVSEKENYFYYTAELAMASAQFPKKVKDEQLAAEIRKFYKEFKDVSCTF